MLLRRKGGSDYFFSGEQMPQTFSVTKNTDAAAGMDIKAMLKRISARERMKMLLLSHVIKFLAKI